MPISYRARRDFSSKVPMPDLPDAPRGSIKETIPMVQDFEAKLSEYAHLLVEVGLNVQPGQTPQH